MMKRNSFLAIVAIALTSVFCLTSCEKKDEPFKEPEPEPTPVTIDTYLCVPIVKGQTDYIDAVYTVSIATETKQIKLAEMTECKDANRINAACNGKDMVESFKDLGGAESSKDKLAIYEYNFGKVSSVNMKSIVYSSKGKLVDEQHEIDFMIGYNFVGNWSSRNDFRLFLGVNDLDGFLEVANAYYK